MKVKKTRWTPQRGHVTKIRGGGSALKKGENLKKKNLKKLTKGGDL